MKPMYFYLFVPKIELISRIKMKETPDFDDLIVPILWTGDLPYREELKIEDQNQIIKILFLDTLKQDYEGVELYSELFSDLRMTIGYFDSLWSFYRVQGDYFVDFAFNDMVDSKTINTIDNTGSQDVDAWFAKHRMKLAKDFED